MANFLDLTTGLPALWAKIKSKFYTKAEVDAAIPSASSTSPEMDGDATVGVSTAYARADHVHPSDTSRVATDAPGVNNGEVYLISQGYTDENSLRIGYQTNSGLQRGVRIGHNYMNIVGLDSPTNDNDAANKKYVDDTVAAIPNEVLVVTFTHDRYENSSYIYIADKSNTEITNAYSAGKIVMGKMQDGSGAYFFNGGGFFATQPDEDYPIISYFYYYGSDYEYAGDFISLIDSNRFYNSVLSKTNTDVYTPTSNYNPATKKYVDDSIPENELFIVTLTFNNNTYTADKTIAQIEEAVSNNKHCIAIVRYSNGITELYHYMMGFTSSVQFAGGYKALDGYYNLYILNYASSGITRTILQLPTNLPYMSDVAISNPTNGQVLTYNSTSGKWENVAVPKEVLYGTVTISETSATFSNGITGYAIASGKKEVIVRNVSTGDIYKLIYFESESGICYFRFNCVTATDIKSISGSSSSSGTTALTGTYSIKPILDTNISSPSAGQALIYDSTNSKWVNGSVVSDVASLTDTTISSPTDGQVLQYDATSSKWVNTTFSAGVTETRVNELIAAALAQYGDGDTASYGYTNASEVNY